MLIRRLLVTVSRHAPVLAVQTLADPLLSEPSNLEMVTVGLESLVAVILTPPSLDPAQVGRSLSPSPYQPPPFTRPAILQALPPTVVGLSPGRGGMLAASASCLGLLASRRRMLTRHHKMPRAAGCWSSCAAVAMPSRRSLRHSTAASYLCSWEIS